MTLKAKIKAKIELSGPDYPLGLSLEAVIGPIEAVLDRKSKCTEKKPGHLPYKTAGSAAVKRRGSEFRHTQTEKGTI